MKFILKIRLGNDAMQTGRDVAEALRWVAQRLEDKSPGLIEETHCCGTIIDVNGNTVGTFGDAP